MHSLIFHSPAETMDFAARTAGKLRPGDVLVLSGDLGAGKTVFTKGLAKGLGVKEMVNSPTFTIVKEYRSGRLPLFHMDVYRISDEEDVGLEDYFDRNGVTVIEWGENIPSWLPDDRLTMRIERIDDHSRKVALAAMGERSKQLCKEIMVDEHTCD